MVLTNPSGHSRISSLPVVFVGTVSSGSDLVVVFALMNQHSSCCCFLLALTCHSFLFHRISLHSRCKRFHRRPPKTTRSPEASNPQPTTLTPSRDGAVLENPQVKPTVEAQKLETPSPQSLRVIHRGSQHYLALTRFPTLWGLL